MLVFTFSNNSFAHGGGTDANGCHKNHKTGEYHCH
ncbi:YHYH domain-containing protein [Mesorhizobium sp. NZP2077]